MELRLQKFIQSMGTLSDIRNLDPLNPTIFQLEHPVTATRYVTIAAITEPSHLGIPINSTWVVLDPTSAYYQKALKLKARAGIVVDGIEALPGLTQVWIEITTYDEIFSDPQYYDTGGSGPQGPQGIPGPVGPVGPAGPAGPRGIDAVVDIDAIVAQVLLQVSPTAPTLSITGASSVNESTSSQFVVNLVIGGIATPITNPITLSAGAPATINSSGLLTVNALTQTATITLSASYAYNGSTLTASKEVTLTAATLTGITVAGVPATVFEGLTFTATATAQYAGGVNAPITPAWSVVPPEAGTINGAGLFTAAQVSADTSFTINASYNEGSIIVTDTAESSNLNIIPTSLVASGAATIYEGLTSQYSVTVTRNNGTTANVSSTAVWSSSDPAATLNASGLLTASLVTGDTPVVVTAEYSEGGVTLNDTVDVTIVNLIPTALNIIGGGQVYEGATLQFNATVESNNGAVQAVTPVWSVSPAGAGSINASGLFTAAQQTADLQATIHAEFTASGITVMNDHVIEVTNIVPVDLALSATALTITEGDTSQITATLTRNDGTTATVTPTYTRSPTSGGTINAAGLFTAAQQVEDTLTTISASYTAAGVTLTSQIDILVQDVPVLMTPYFGAAPTNSVKNGALILSLSERGPNNNRLNDSFQIIDGPGISMFYAYPVSYGLATFTDLSNGFQGGWDGAGGAGDGTTLGPITVNVTVGGVSTPFYLYRTDQENISPSSNPTNWRVS